MVVDRCGLLQGVAFDPQNPDRILVDIVNQVWQSTNRGHNWSLLTTVSSPANSAILISRVTGHIFVSTRNDDNFTGVLRSRDSGQSWEPKPFPAAAQAPGFRGLIIWSARAAC